LFFDFNGFLKVENKMKTCDFVLINENVLSRG
jgi:hypothetical protein